MIFLLKLNFKNRFKIVAFPLWRRDPKLLCVIFCLCNSVSADHGGMAASRFLAAAAACVLLMSFAAEES